MGGLPGNLLQETADTRGLMIQREGQWERLSPESLPVSGPRREERMTHNFIEIYTPYIDHPHAKKIGYSLHQLFEIVMLIIY